MYVIRIKHIEVYICNVQSSNSLRPCSCLHKLQPTPINCSKQRWIAINATSRFRCDSKPAMINSIRNGATPASLNLLVVPSMRTFNLAGKLHSRVTTRFLDRMALGAGSRRQQQQQQNESAHKTSTMVLLRSRPSVGLSLLPGARGHRLKPRSDRKLRMNG